VVMIARPQRPQVPYLETVAEAAAWCRRPEGLRFVGRSIP
jgi:hypothetical protein